MHLIFPLIDEFPGNAVCVVADIQAHGLFTDDFKRISMLNSMTGFARAERSVEEGNLVWEARTVNHRYLEAQIKLPEGLRAMEPDLRALAGTKLGRGKLDATLHFQRSSAVAPELTLNVELARQLLEHSKRLGGELDSAAPVNPVDILRWPDVLQEQPVDLDNLIAPITELLATTLDKLRENRANEGQRIEVVLNEKLDQVSELVAAVRARAPEVLRGIRARIEERAATLDTKVDPERLEQELLLLAQKLDVAEELDRLDAHISEARAAFASGGPVGRRLDFLMQEFNREANTLGSKSADAETTRQAVDIKVLIEQMREQVQNIE
ncbi:MAG: YicC/YloC family endoribonuclease [Gammaproteobacteria bacterium]